MIKETHYCDYCGKRIPEGSIIRQVRTPWQAIANKILEFNIGTVEIGGDGCQNCWESYRKWMKERATSNTKVTRENNNI